MTEMDCSEYLALASEFRDGRVREHLVNGIQAHLDSCPLCNRHRSTLERGVDLLRALPGLEIPGDFHGRLAHRIYHLEDGASIARETVGSGATTVSVLAVAVLIALAAWTPRASMDGPRIELPAVIVAAPSATSFPRGFQRSTFSGRLSAFTTADFQDGPWGDTHQVLFQYSSLSERRRHGAPAGLGTQ